jgi:hypothetical protein
MRRHLWKGLILIPLFCSPLGAQEGVPTAQPVTFWRLELAQVERRLQAIQEKALRDPELARLDSLLGAEVAAAMARHDPELHLATDDVERLARRLTEAEGVGDEAAALAIAEEIRALNERFERARAAALKEPALADQVAVFNETLRLRMVEESPDAAQLFRRLERLNASLAGADSPP